MPNPILIVHGYSDGPDTFQDLASVVCNLKDPCYAPEDISYISYASLDDQANFEDFSDKLDELVDRRYRGQQFDVICHSTGSLVVRAWLVLQYSRQLDNGNASPKSPIRRLLCFAPANFGSDLAMLGQSFSQRLRVTLTNRNVRPGEDLQSGKLVLQALEPASPFQWNLSHRDLFGVSYFSQKLLSFDKLCLPFIFAAGNYEQDAYSLLVKELAKPGTDSTVRICGTSLDVRKCTVNFFPRIVHPEWNEEIKFDRIPFCVFNKFSHCTLVKPYGDAATFNDPLTGPLRLLQQALNTDSSAEYKLAIQAFDDASEKNYAQIQGPNKDRYQQFFFKVSDDTGLSIDDFYLDFHVLNQDNTLNAALTDDFDKFLQADFHKHSVDPSCRVMLINCVQLDDYLTKLDAAKAKLAFCIGAHSPIDDVSYEDGVCVVYDSQVAAPPDEPSFLYPNTTTLVEVIVVRRESDKLLNMLDHTLQPIAQSADTLTIPALLGRAAALQGAPVMPPKG